MSKELKGKNGKVVGSIEYFNALNKNCILGDMVSDYKFNYYRSIKDIANKSSTIFCEVYKDLSDNLDYLDLIDKSDRRNTIDIIVGLSGLCNIVNVSTSMADKCISLLSVTSKSGVSDNDVTKSAKFVLSNKYFDKRDSIKILEKTVKYGANRAIKGDTKKATFIREVQRSNRKGYFEDVLNVVNYLENKKILIGKCGKKLCSKAYNRYVASVQQDLKFVMITVEVDLDRGMTNEDYLKDPSPSNLMKFAEDIEKCGIKRYNFSKCVEDLAWFVGGDVEKILRLQRTLYAAGYYKISIDGVYGKVTEESWVDYVNKTLASCEQYQDVNVWGIGIQRSKHIMAGYSGGFMIYIDDYFNVALMATISGEIVSDFDYSKGVTVEWSRTAETVDDMSGKAVTFGASVSYYDNGVSLSHSEAFGKSSVDSNSITFYKGKGLVPASSTVGISENVLLLKFNPKEWVENVLGVK